MRVLKLFLLLSSCFFIAFGWPQNISSAVTFGAILYIVSQTLDLFSIIDESKKIKTSIKAIDLNAEKKTIIDHITSFIGLIILFSGLILLLIGTENKSASNFQLVSGAIIWIGSFLCYFTYGVIVKEILEIPLKMGYGGWYIDYRKKKF